MNCTHSKVLAILVVLTILGTVTLAGCGATATATQLPTSPAATAAQPTAKPAATSDVQAKPQLPTEIVLPAMLPFTGAMPYAGTTVKDGIEMAVAEINDAGGIRGSKLKVEYYDSKLDPTEGAALARKIVADKRYPMMLGDWSSSVTLAALPIFEEAEMCLFSVASSGKISKSAWGFKWQMDQEIYGSLMAHQAIKELGHTKLAFLYIQTDFGNAIKTGVEGTAKQLGAQLVMNEGFGGDTKDFRALLSKVKESGAQVLVLGSDSATGALIINQTRELGVDIPFVGDGVFIDPGFFQVTGKNANGLLAQIPRDNLPDPAQQSPTATAFHAAFQKRYGKTEQGWERNGYDMVKIVASVIDQVGVDRVAVRDGLQGLKDFATTWGPVTLAAKHWPLVDIVFVKYDLATSRYVLTKDAPEEEYGAK